MIHSLRFLMNDLGEVRELDLAPNNGCLTLMLSTSVRTTSFRRTSSLVNTTTALDAIGEE